MSDGKADVRHTGRPADTVPCSGGRLSGVGPGDFEEMWRQLEQIGLPRVSASVERSRGGDTLREAAELVREGGYRGLALPIGETCLLAAWALSMGGLPDLEGPLTVAPVLGEEIEFRRERDGWSLHGTARRVPWTRNAGYLVVVGAVEQGTVVGSVSVEECVISTGENVAGEPRDDVRLDGVVIEEPRAAFVRRTVSTDAIRLRGALVRALALAGAMQRVLELSVEHAKTRQQFGRPVGRFQAVQQQLALMAGEVAASGAAIDAAVEAASKNGVDNAWAEIASAKITASAAAGQVASIAHQVHGAVGFTERHELGSSTLRLWAWREEFGGESEWAARLGESLAAAGEEGLWDAVIEPASVLHTTGEE